MGEELVNQEPRLKLIVFEAVAKYKSVNRAFRRGHVSPYGQIYPRRPFNNRTPRKGTRPINELKKMIYGQLRKRLED